MKLSRAAREELLELSRSQSLRKELREIASRRNNRFVKEGRVDMDACIEFVDQFNEFMGHAPKRFRRIIDRKMIL